MYVCILGACVHAVFASPCAGHDEIYIIGNYARSKLFILGHHVLSIVELSNNFQYSTWSVMRNRNNTVQVFCPFMFSYLPFGMIVCTGDVIILIPSMYV